MTRTLRYTTPHGIAVSPHGVAGQLQERSAATCCANWTGTAASIFPRATSIPGRYSRWDIASRPPAARDRGARPAAWSSARSTCAGRCSTRCSYPLLAEHPHWEELRAGGGRRAGRAPEAAAAPVSRRGAQQAALGVLHPARAHRGVPRPRGPVPRAGGRLRLRPAVPVRADRDEAAAQRPQGPAPVPLRRHLLHGPQEGADRALPVRFRVREPLHPGARPRRRRGCPPPAARDAGAHRQRPHARRVHGQGGDRARGHAARRLLRSRAAPDLPHAVLAAARPSCSSACSTPAPAPTSSSCSSATSN